MAVSVFSAVDFSEMNIRNLQDIARLTPGVVLTDETRDDLRGNVSFRGLSDVQVDIQFNALNGLLVDSIQLIGRENRDVGNALRGLYLNDRIGIATGSGFIKDAEIRHDGSAYVGDEAINLHWIPKLKDGSLSYRLFEADSYRFMNTLANEGYRATLGGYEGKAPENPVDGAAFGWAQYNQNLRVRTWELARLDDTLSTMAGISADLTVPTDASAYGRGIGNQLLRDYLLTDEEKQDWARRLSGYVAGSLMPKAELNHGYETLALAVADLFQEKKFHDLGSHTDALGTSIPWNFQLRPSIGGFGDVTIQGGGGDLEMSDPEQPIVMGRNSFWQYGGRADGTVEKQEVIIPEVDSLSSGYYADGKLFVGGWSGVDGLSKYYGYTDIDGDGFVEEDSKEFAFSTDMFSNGLQFVRNEARDELYGFDRGSRNLYRLDTPVNGFPTAFTHSGTIGESRWDVTSASFSDDGNWAIGWNLGYEYSLQPHSFVLEARYNDAAEEYEPIRTSFRYEEVQIRPSVAEALWSGSSLIRATYTPNVEFSAYKLESDVWNLKGTATTDPYGRAIFELDEPFVAGFSYRFGSEADDSWSPTYVAPDIASGLRFKNPRLSRGTDLSASYFYIPGTDVALELGASVDGDSTQVGLKTVPSFGLDKEKIDITPLGSSGFLRGRILEKPPVAKPNYFAMPPTGIFTYYPGWNDVFLYGALFTLAEQSNNRFLSVPGMGSLTSRLAMIADPFGFLTFGYKIQQAALAEALNEMIVVPEYSKAFFPPVFKNEQGEEYVTASCLIIGGENYPVFQFALRPPDNCLFIHWHSPFFARVFHLDEDAEGIPDPDPPFCGYGTILELLPRNVDVPLDKWRAFVFGRLLSSNLPGSTR